MELRMFKYRLYPSNKQKTRMINSVKVCKTIYNELLALSIDSWKFGQVSLNKFDYDKIIKGRFNIHSQVAQNVSDRVHKAFSNFFRRLKDKSCKQKGFPRFKSRVNSITFPQSGFKILSNKKLRLSKIGNIPIILHRIPKGKIKTLTIKQNKVSQWFAVFSCEIETTNIIHSSNEKVGIDVGLKNFVTISNGKIISNPHNLIKSEKRLKFLQRRLSKKVKGSINRKKARFKLAKQHLRIANQRLDFLHKTSRNIVNKYCFIAVEDLNIKGMIRNHCLAKHITDASWNNFVRMLSYKAITCGGQLTEVNPRNTSKTCSKCGTINDIDLSIRQFICCHCGFVCHRDLNASINILRVGTDCAELNACEHNVRPSLKAVVNEAGTIHGK